MSNVSKSKAAARRPSASAVPRGGIARGPCLKCFFNAATYRCDNAVNFRFMFVCRIPVRLSGMLVPSMAHHKFNATISQLLQLVYGVNTPPARPFL